MRTHVKFESSRFPPYDGEEAEINPGRYGKRLAEFIRNGLAERGVATGEIYSEDWGWAVPVRNDAFPLWIGCGNLDGQPEGEFLCFIEPSKPFVRKWFKEIDTRVDVTRVADALDALLTADPEIRSVRWEEDRG